MLIVRYHCLAIAVLWFCSLSAASVSGESVVAVVDGRAVQSTELDRLLGDKLLRLKAEEYAVQMAALNGYLDQVLLSREAERHSITVAELLRREVVERVPPVTEAEARAVLDTSPKATEQLEDGQAVKAAMEDLKRRRLAKRRGEFLASLRQRYPTQIRLEPPRLTLPITGGQSKGPAEARVSIVVFSDFQCPYCSNLDSSLRRLGQEYGDQLRITSKQFPLAGHRQAEKAAEAALCAAEQGRYWEMHDMLFSDQRSVAREQFSDLARRVGLDLLAFEGCMISHRSSAELARDVVDATSVGVNSTPTLFINGLLVLGAKPYVAPVSARRAVLAGVPTLHRSVPGGSPLFHGTHNVLESLGQVEEAGRNPGVEREARGARVIVKHLHRVE
jgi:protein-disulfide isomerase